jgi:PAS domain S-box-containing protein
MRASSWVVFVILFAVTLLLWQATRSNDGKIRKARFHNRVTLIMQRIQDAVSINEKVLRGCAGLFTAVPQATRQTFVEYVTRLEIERMLPGIQGMGFAKRILAPDLTDHIRSIRDEGFASYTVRPPGERAEYVPIVYLEPFRDLNLRAFGYDMFSEPVRRAAMERARDGHQTILSGMVTLVQEGAGTAIQQGFLIYHPVYSTDPASSTIADRRRTLRGYVYLPVRFGDFFDRIVFENNLMLGITIVDGETVDSTHVSYASTSRPGSEKLPGSYVPTFEETVRLTVFGRIWTVKFLSLPSYDDASDFSRPWYVLAFGVFLSTLIGMTFQFMGSRTALQAANELNLALKEVREELETRVQEQTADLKEANDVLRLSERNLRDAQAMANIGNWSVHLATGEFTWSEEMFRISGRDPSLPPPTFQKHSELYTPESWQRALAVVEASTLDGETFALDMAMCRPDGTNRWVHSRGNTRKDSLGKVIELYGTTQDVTKMKQVLDDLGNSEAKYRTLFEASPDGIMIANLDTKMLMFANPAICQMLGYSEEELVTKDPWSFLPKDEIQSVMAKFGSQTRGEQSLAEVVPFIRKDGTLLYVDVNSRVATLDRKACLVGFFRDITERRINQELLREVNVDLEEKVRVRTAQLKDSEERYRTVIEKTGQIMYEMDTLTGHSSRAKAIEEVTENSLEEFGNQHKEQFFNCIHPDDRDRVLPQIIAPTKIPGPYAMEYRIRHKDGSFRFIIDQGVSFADAEGRGFLLIGTITDVSERKQLETALRLKNSELEEAGRVKSDFVANVSHEIRTPLNAIIGFADLALKTSLNQKQADYLGKIHLSGLSLLAIVNDILDFSKMNAGKLTLESIDFCFDHVVDSLVAMVGPSAMAKGLNVIINIPFDIPKCLIGDPLHLGQILTNLMSNAVKFTEHGEIELGVSHRKLSPDTLELRVFIRDTGIGIPPDRLVQLFHPFTQADLSITRKFGGTGLGLSICKRLVELMHGRIDIESQVGKGTSVSFTAVMHFDSASPEENILPANLWDLRILLLETHPTMKAWFRTFFNQFPFSIDVVSSTQEALKAVEEMGRTISYDLFLIDSPGIDRDVLSLLQTLRHMPDLWNHPKVILLLCSPMEDSLREQAISHGVSEFLLRPVTPSSVVNAIINIFAPPTRERMAIPSKTADDLDLEGLNLLVVEDNPMNQQIARELLESAGVTVNIAKNGLIAVESLMNEAGSIPYDAILMDIQMPEMDGYEATRRIRRMPRFAGTPIIAMTAHAMAEERGKVTAAGMNDHVAKPIIPKDLFRTLRRWTRPRSPVAAGLNPPQQSPSRLTPEGGTPGTPPHATTDVPSIHGVNFQEGLARLGGNSELYLRLLREFPAAQEGELGKIGQALSTKDPGKARTLLHSLKGLAGNLSLDNLFQTAGTLEKALQASDWAESSRLFELLVSGFHRLSRAIDALNISPNRTPCPISEKPLQPMTFTRVQEPLESLKTVLIGNNPQAGQILMALMAGFEIPANCVSDFGALKVAIGQFEFDQALLVLASIEEKLGGSHHAP